MTEITVRRVAYDLAGAAEATSTSLSTIKSAIDSGDLTPHYVGLKATKPLIRAVDLDDWVSSLPTTRRNA